MRHSILLLIVLLCCSIASAQEIRVKGHVVDCERGDELPYAAVYVDANHGTLTNYDGDFTIKVEAGTYLRITCVGYEDLHVKAEAGEHTYSMKPMERTMRELDVYPWEGILSEASKKLNKEYKKKKGKKSQFFLRMNTSFDTRELTEAFVEANSAANLRDIVVLKGRHGRKTSKGLADPAIADMNFHHPFEVGPLIRDSRFWRSMATPMYEYNNYFSRYKITGELLTDSTGKKLYRIFLKKKNPEKRGTAILTGTLYIDQQTLQVLRFDGQVEDTYVDVQQGMKRTTSPINIGIHVNYRHDKGFTEVSDMSTLLSSGDLRSQAILYNVDDMKLDLKGKNGKKSQENILKTIGEVGFDKTLWESSNVIQRTEEEERLAGLENQTETVASVTPKDTTKRGRLLERLSLFNQVIPQEKVYLHMDNTCYFLGDTIWFAAYSRRTNDGKPSDISGVLYCELYNQDGYLMERQLIEMQNGRGHGNFVLNTDFYGGFYEIRAYTRHQLNWGEYEHKHSSASKEWYLNSELERKHYRDYDKLYSRVFPVYDAPKKEGEYFENMTMRPMRRYFKNDPHKRKATLTLYPEGGNLVDSLPCRVAYEALWDDGEEVELKDHPSRGILELTGARDTRSKITFLDKSGNQLSADLPKPEREGASLRVDQTDSLWQVRIQLSSGICKDSVGVTVMHEGNVDRVYTLDSTLQVITIKKDSLREGVNQLTVFDVGGQILADRLFFNTHPGKGTLQKVNINVGLLQEEGDSIQSVRPEEASFGAYQPIRLSVQSKPYSVLSLSVRDQAHSDHLYDNATLRTEMLLASEVKGFIPNPQQYFEKDDAEHRAALDLLMMIQGWRRFNWQDMAIPHRWERTQITEKTPIITGRVYKNPDWAYHDFTDRDYESMIISSGHYDPENPTTLVYANDFPIETLPDVPSESTNAASSETSGDGEIQAQTKLDAAMSLLKETKRTDYNKRGGKGEVLVHAEVVSADGKESRAAEQMTRDGYFQFLLPGYYDNAILFLSASDSTKWKGKPYTWIQQMPEYEDLPDGHQRRFQVDPPEYAVRVDFPYPRFVKPYNYYQQRLLETADPVTGRLLLADGTTQMSEVKIGAKHGGMKRFTDSIPAFTVDAYQAYNDALDGGIYYPSEEMIVRNYLGDYGLEFPYVTISCNGAALQTSNIQIRYGYDITRRAIKNKLVAEDSVYMRGNLASIIPYDICGHELIFLAPGELSKYHKRSYVDKYIIYTDYQPRLEGDDRYYGSYLPNTHIAIYPFADDSRRPIYRDRRYILKGYSYADDFYHPVYRDLNTEKPPKDYRRTLYWNPELKLNNQGQAVVELYNNGKHGQISISAEGMTYKGEFLEN